MESKNSQHRILIIKGSGGDSGFLVNYLGNLGYQASCSVVEDEGLIRQVISSNNWDVVIGDYNLSDFNIPTALSISKQVAPNVPFIIVSDSTVEDFAVEALKAGANDYILKNNLSRLLPSIEREIKEVKIRLENLRIQDELKEREEELRKSQKLEAIGRLAGGIAHDFNNILATVLIQTDHLLQDIEQKGISAELLAAIQRGLKQIKKSSERASSLTRQLLTFSRRQVIQPVVISLNETIRDMEGMVRPLISENIDFKIKLEPNLKNIKVDLSHIEQIVMNLVVNSKDAMANGGSLTLETQNGHVDQSMAEHYNVKAGPYAVLAVTDTGVGMSEETKRKIFDPFFTTKEVGKGTGLGLSTVYGIIKQNDGLIFVDSEVNKGTMILAYFPQVEEEVEKTEVVKIADQDLNGHETILVVEDEADLLSLVSGCLETKGYKVLQASNGINALEMLKKNAQNKINLIVTDVVMPGMSGQELAKKVNELGIDIKFLFLSGYSEDILRNQGVKSKEIHFLEKPYSVRGLLVKVRQILN